MVTRHKSDSFQDKLGFGGEVEKFAPGIAGQPYFEYG